MNDLFQLFRLTVIVNKGYCMHLYIGVFFGWLVGWLVLDFCFLGQGFFSVLFGACPGTHPLDQASLELKDIHLPVPPECWD